MYSDTTIFSFYYFKCWQPVSASIGHHQANIYQKKYIKKYQIYKKLKGAVINYK
jgi:predicted membrane-bound dolichyl-phosphate-mannose-protein mannosyltransferase